MKYILYPVPILPGALIVRSDTDEEFALATRSDYREVDIYTNRPYLYI